MVKLKLLALAMIWWWSWWTIDHHQGVVADPQTLLLDAGCSTCNVTNMPIFYANINSIFCDLRSQVSDQSKRFAKAQQGIGDIVAYAMFQCRNYLSQADCLSCFNTASAQIHIVCSAAYGARVIYDGCFLRYESNGFFNQTTTQGNGVLCGTRTSSDDSNAFSAAGLLQALTDLQIEITTNKGFFASTKTQVAGGVIYAIAQCAETVTKSGCLDCLKVGFNNIQSCLPNTDGRAFDAGCFIRYSNISFSDGEQKTSNSNPENKKPKGKRKTNIKRFFTKAFSSSTGGIIGGASATVAVGTTVAIYKSVKRRRSKKPNGDYSTKKSNGDVVTKKGNGDHVTKKRNGDNVTKNRNDDDVTKKPNGDDGTKNPNGDGDTESTVIAIEHGACGEWSNVPIWKPPEVTEWCCQELDQCRPDWCTIS